MRKQKKEAGFDLKPFLIGIGVLLIPLYVLIISKISNSDKQLVSLSTVALIAGAIFEGKMLFQKWSKVFYSILFSFVFSFFCFLPGKNESNYNIEDHIVFWPYYFLFLFITYSISSNKDKLIPKLSEGVTMILSLALIYWVLMHELFNSPHFLIKSLSLGAILISGFSILNGFLLIPLSRSLRLFLSLWSSLIMLIFAVDNIIILYQNSQILDSSQYFDKTVIALEYFLLGVSSVYIAQNGVMILGYLPGKNRFFNDEYFEDLKVLTNDHLTRYSDSQSGYFLSTVCFILPLAFFVINYKFNFLSVNNAVWLTFFLLNRVVYLYNTKNAIVA